MKIKEMKTEQAPESEENGKIGPYILAWLFGVPISVLFVVFLIRSCV